MYFRIKLFEAAGKVYPCLAALLAFAAFAACGGGGAGGGPPEGGGEGFSPDGSPPPLIGSVEPRTGPVEGGEHVLVYGGNFVPGLKTRVIFGNALATDVTVLEADRIACVTPANAAGEVDVTVVNAYGRDTLPAGFTYTTDPSILWLNYTRKGSGIAFVWKLSAPGDDIVFFRGAKPAARLDGDAESFLYQEKGIGRFRYSVALYVKGRRTDVRDVVVDLGRVTWDPPPSGAFTGFYLYVAEAVINAPYKLLPYDNPADYSYDAGMNMEVPLCALFDRGLIGGEKKYFLAASTYVGTGARRRISPLTPPIAFYCQVILGRP